jgi:hypothetical protein
MTTKSKIARGKLSLPELVQGLNNVDRVCHITVYSCQQSDVLWFDRMTPDAIASRFGARAPEP